jgi:hypothetical protein
MGSRPPRLDSRCRNHWAPWRQFLAVLFLPTILAHGQELAPEVLDRAKAATSFVVVESAPERRSASGFLFLKQGDHGYVLTCEHVVRGVERVGIVFDSGLSGERSVSGEVIALDPDRDLACVLLADAAQLPVPLALEAATTVRETETVYVAGFPFGRFLAAGDKNPEISVTKVAVSSIRHDLADRITSVQLSGDVNPGNSGGPVLDMHGRVVGVAQSKVSGSSTAFAVPAEELTAFLEGRPQVPTFAPALRSSTHARFKVTSRLIDPLRNIRRIRVAWCQEDALSGPLKPDQDGRWRQMRAAKISMSDMKIEKALARGELSFTRDAAEPERSMQFVQLYYERKDGEATWTEPTPLEVVFMPDVARANKRRQAVPPKSNEAEPFGQPNEGAVEPKEETGPTPAATALDAPEVVELPPSKGEILHVADRVVIQQKLLLRAALAELILAPAGDALYALDLSEGMVYKVDPETLEIRARQAAADNALAMCLTADGTTLYVGGHDPVRPNRSGRPSQPAGRIQVISTATLETSAEFEVAFAVRTIAASNVGTVVASDSENLTLIDGMRKSIISRLPASCQGAHVRVHPDQSRVYSAEDSPIGQFSCTLLSPGETGEYESYSSLPRPGESAGDFVITPDGRYLISCGGAVLRLSKSRTVDMRYAGRIDQGVAIGVARDCNTFLVSTREGFLKIYDLGKVELVKSIPVGVLCTRLALDPPNQRVFVVAEALPKDDGFPRNEFEVGDILCLALTER